MKTKVVIIEDNFCKYFTTKQVLESQLKIEVSVVDVSMGGDIAEAMAAVGPDVIVFRPNGGVTDLLEKLKKRHINRRNTEITLVLAEEFDADVSRRLQDFAATYSRRVAAAA